MFFWELMDHLLLYIASINKTVCCVSLPAGTMMYQNLWQAVRVDVGAEPPEDAGHQRRQALDL
jgi:hypothetical protein